MVVEAGHKLDLVASMLVEYLLILIAYLNDGLETVGYEGG